MTNGHKREFCLIAEGNYFTVDEAEKALREPFIEEWIEQTGKYRIHNLNDIEVAGGFSLGELSVKMLEEEFFEITSLFPNRPITEEKAKKIAEAIRRFDMFDEISIEERE